MKGRICHLFIVLLIIASTNASGSVRRSHPFAVRDSIPAVNDTTAIKDTIIVPCRDSLSIDDSLYFFTHIDTLSLPYLDSVYTAFFDSLAMDLPDARDIKRAERQNRRDYKDSVRKATPRVLQTYAIPDSLYYERILMWTHDRDFNEIKLQKIDTTANYHFNDYPFFKKDVNATYLGPVGSPTLYYNYFKRENVDEFPMFSPYIGDSYTPENMPQYNTKTPYTELAYWGTLFAMKQLEESEIKILTSQNITPALNFTIAYTRLGSRGMLVNEDTDNRTFMVGLNYVGKKYLMNSGYIGQTIKRTENGGIRESTWIRDTTIDAKAIEVNLANAKNYLKRRTYFITQSYAIPMNFFRKNSDSLSVGDGTMAYIGHSGEYTIYGKKYTDEITTDDRFGRDFYFNKFHINNIKSNDSLGVTRFENKAFLRLQPYSADALLSKIDAGIGYQILNLYSFDPSYYLTRPKSVNQHNLYLYAAASGKFRKYIEWRADGRYTYAGYNQNDFYINGNVKFSIYPIDEGIHLSGRFNTSLKEPHLFYQKLYTNHNIWNNDFEKISETRAEGALDIPKYKLQAFFGYALVDGMIYHDTTSAVRQHTAPMSIMSAYLQKDFKLWMFHFDNKVLFQLSSEQDILPLPKLALNLRYYFQFDVVKDVMNMQLGANALFTTKFYAPTYSPALGAFYNQTQEKIGGTPYIDVFVNVQWKRACVFVKYTNAFIGWPDNDYFSAYHYIRPQPGFKFGIFWPFYVR